MSEARVFARLTRDLGVVWPNAEQTQVLHAIFAGTEAARAAFLSWTGGLDVAADFDPGVMRLLPLLYLRLQRDGVDHALMARLKGVYRRSWTETHTLFHATAPALAALHAAGIDTLLLKGAPMVLQHYRNFGARPMADLDIAIRPGTLDAALHVLAAAGWRPSGPVGRDDITFRHAVALRGPGGQEIDLHWHMLFESGSDAADAPFWADRQPLLFRDIPTSCPAPSLALVHTLAHGMRPNTETPIRWIADSLTLLRDPAAPIDWPQVVATAQLLGLAHRIRLALTHLRDAYAAPVPETALAALAAVPLNMAEWLERRVMTPGRETDATKITDRMRLLGAETCRIARAHSWTGALVLLPAFMRYRLGIPSWRRWARRMLGRAWRAARG